jgi:hypothetical protein
VLCNCDAMAFVFDDYVSMFFLFDNFVHVNHHAFTILLLLHHLSLTQLLSNSFDCRPSAIERRARRLLKHVKIVPVRGISTKAKAESFVKEACWVMGVQDMSRDIGSVIAGLKAGVEVDLGWLMGCVVEEKSRWAATMVVVILTATIMSWC